MTPIKVPLAQDCSTCIIDSLQTLIPLLSDDKHVQFQLYSRAFKKLADGFEKKVEPAPLSIELYQDLYKAAGNMDPYHQLKIDSNSAALRALPKIKKEIEELDGYDKFKTAVSASVVGNVIDYNTAGHNPNLNGLEDLFEDILRQGFAIDDSDVLWNALNKDNGTLLFLADNAGETFFDIPLLSIIKSLGWNIIYIVKGQAMINDATLDDVIGTEIEGLADIKTTGAWAHGTPRKWVSDDFIKLVNQSDIVISKGQANIETFPEIQAEIGVETYFILRGKCPHISQAIGARKGDNIVLGVHK